MYRQLLTGIVLVSGVFARHGHHHRPNVLNHRDIVAVDSIGGICPAVSITTTLEIQPVYYSEFFPYNTAVDAFRNGATYTISRAPLTLVVVSELTRTLVATGTTIPTVASTVSSSPHAVSTMSSASSISTGAEPVGTSGAASPTSTRTTKEATSTTATTSSVSTPQRSASFTTLSSSQGGLQTSTSSPTIPVPPLPTSSVQLTPTVPSSDLTLTSAPTTTMTTTTALEENLEIGQGLPVGLVTDLPPELFLILAFTDMPQTNSPVATPTSVQSPQRILQRRQDDRTTADPVALADLSTPTGQPGSMPGQDFCDESTPLVLRHGSLLRSNGSIGKIPSDTSAVLGFLDAPPNNQVNITFSLLNGVLSWIAPDVGPASFFDCDGSLYSVFAGDSPPACRPVIVGAIAGRVCRQRVEQTRPVDATFTAPLTASISQSTTFSSSTPSTSVLPTDLVTSLSSSSSSRNITSSTSSASSVVTTIPSSVLAVTTTQSSLLSSAAVSLSSERMISTSTSTSTTTSTTTSTISTTSTTSATSLTATATTISLTTSTTTSVASQVSSPTIRSPTTDHVSSTSTVDHISTATSTPSPTSSFSALIRTSTSVPLGSFTFSNVSTILSSPATQSANSSSVRNTAFSNSTTSSPSTTTQPSLSNSITLFTSMNSTTTSNYTTTRISSSTFNITTTSSIRSTTSTLSPTPTASCLNELPAACSALSAIDGLSLLVVIPSCQAALSSYAGQGVTCLSLANVNVLTTGSSVLNCLTNSGILCPIATTSTSTSTVLTTTRTTTTPTPSPTSNCRNDLPEPCLVLESLNGLSLVGQMPLCRLALGAFGPQADTCLNIIPTIFTTGSSVLTCLVASSGIICPRLTTSTTTSTTSTPTPSQTANCLNTLPAACTSLANTNGLALITTMPLCVLALASYQTPQSTSCLSIVPTIFTQGSSVVTCLTNSGVLCPAVTTTTLRPTTSTTSTSTPTPTPDCIAMPLSCTALSTFSGLALLPQAGLCSSALVSAGLQPPTCINPSNIGILTSGLALVNCISSSGVLCQARSTTTTMTTTTTTTRLTTTTTTTATATPTAAGHSCLVVLPPACSSLILFSGLTLISASSSCLLALQSQPDLAPSRMNAATMCVNSLNPLGNPQGVDVVGCLNAAVLCPL